MSPHFSKPTINDAAKRYLLESLQSGQLAGDGPFTQRCHRWLESHFGTPALLTHSCTAALEMSALLAGIKPGDEIIMPSYTFVSTANAFVLRGGVPVFIDIRPDTLNLDETLVAQAMSERTKAIVPVHYAGVACEMDALMAHCNAHNLMLIEDAAQAHHATYKGRLLGTFGALGCLSYHVTKNVVSGEGGALIVNDQRLMERAQIIREKGTNRTAYRDRKVDKYEWLDMGSSYLPSDLLAALLLAQLETGTQMTARRLSIWAQYHEAFAAAEAAGKLRRPIVPGECKSNAHIYYLLLPDDSDLAALRSALEQAQVPAHTHYVPLHSSPAGKQFGLAATPMPVTDRVARTLIRLPIHANMTDDDAQQIAQIILDALKNLHPKP